MGQRPYSTYDGYDLANDRVRLDLPNGTRTLRDFDPRHRIQRETVWSPEAVPDRYRCTDNRYAYDAVNNVRKQVERFNEGAPNEIAHNRVLECVYDAVYRLTNHRDHDVTV